MAHSGNNTDTCNNETKITIPFSSIEDHLQCSICLTTIRGAILTPCGHRYCSRCITEWTGRNHTCPCCNSRLNCEQFYCDIQFDNLVDAVLKERDDSEEQIFSNLIGNQDTKSTTPHSDSNLFQSILKKQMKVSLLSHQRYFEKLQTEHDKYIAMLENGLTPEVFLSFKGLDFSGSSEEIKSHLTENLQHSKKLAADSFDKYLKENVPNLEILPVTISVYIADKDMRVENVIISPNDTLRAIKPVIEAAMVKKSNKILSWKDDTGVKILLGPLLKQERYDAKEFVNNFKQSEFIQPLQWDSKLVFQHSIKPGSEIFLCNVFKCESDLPKQCFSQTFSPNTNQVCDYFTCSQCKVNWICKSCVQCCHNGHSIQPFAINHSPSWACCYCPKKKLCKMEI